MHVKTGFMISDRDFVFVAKKVQLDNGGVAIIAASVEDEEVPPKKKAVRAHLYIGGWMLEPHVDDPSKWYAYYLVKGDLKGLIPKFAVNMFATQLGELPMNLNKHLNSR